MRRRAASGRVKKSIVKEWAGDVEIVQKVYAWKRREKGATIHLHIVYNRTMREHR